MHDVWHALCVHMEDRGIDDLRYIRAVVSRSLSVWCRGEANLVVDDDMDRAANFVVL